MSEKQKIDDKVYLIIPCFNEAECIRQTLENLFEVCPEYHVVCINDGSRDQTGEILHSIQNDRLTVLDLPFNCGIGTAVQTGLLFASRAGADYAVKFDGDGQHPAEKIKDLLSPLQNDSADFVTGSRFLTPNQGFQSSRTRRIGIRFFYFLSAFLTGQALTDSTSGFRAYNREALQFAARNYPAFDYPEPEESILLLRNRFRVVEIPCEMHSRQGGVSSISPRKAVYYMIKVSLSMIVARFRQQKEKSKCLKSS